MYLALSINGELTEWAFCRKHNEWFIIGNEMNCCSQESERKLIEEAIAMKRVGYV